jgi:hypothetical protein
VSKAPSVWVQGLTDAHFYDMAEFELQADPHRLYIGLRLDSGQTVYLHIVHDPEGFRVLLDQEKA